MNNLKTTDRRDHLTWGERKTIAAIISKLSGEHFDLRAEETDANLVAYLHDGLRFGNWYHAEGNQQ
jgi:hypothetical protein